MGPAFKNPFYSPDIFVHEIHIHYNDKTGEKDHENTYRISAYGTKYYVMTSEFCYTADFFRCQLPKITLKQLVQGHNAQSAKALRAALMTEYTGEDWYFVRVSDIDTYFQKYD